MLLDVMGGVWGVKDDDAMMMQWCIIYGRRVCRNGGKIHGLMHFVVSKSKEANRAEKLLKYLVRTNNR